MYIVKTIEEFLKEDGYDNYRLCFIDDIPETVFRYDKEYEFPGEFSNPDYEEGLREYYAYFTPLSLSEQWGDDWNDSPVEDNAGKPYDHDEKYNKIDILIIPYQVPFSMYPWDYNSRGSLFSAETINMGAIPWIFLKYKKEYDVISAGISPRMFCNVINRWRNKKCH